MPDDEDIIEARMRDKIDELTLYYRELLEDLPAEEVFVSERLTRRGVEKTIELIAETIIEC